MPQPKAYPVTPIDNSSESSAERALMLRIGDYEIFSFVADRFRLDGGAMFGSVPKTLWSKLTAVDDQNRIPLACRLLVLRSSSRLIVVDTGCGRKWQAKEREIFAFEDLPPIRERLPGVTDVILTHFHFDHAGGVSEIGSDGLVRLSYPGATHHVSAKNIEVAQSPGPRERASYFSANVQPVIAGNHRLVNDGEEILPGIRVTISNGHTRGLLLIYVSDGSQTLVFPSDLIPTSHHLPLPYVMGYDMCAQQSLAEKEQLLARAVSENQIVFFEHDPEIAAGHVIVDAKGRYLLGEQIILTEFPG